MSRLERIVRVCGGELLDGGRRASIPGPGHGPDDRSVSLLETEDGRVLVHCFSPRDHWRDVMRWLVDQRLIEAAHAHPAPTPARKDSSSAGPDPTRRARAERIWREATAVAGTPAERYLVRRAIAESLARSEALRFHPAMTNLTDRLRRPALVAAISDGAGALQGVQVTLLAADGAAKAAVPTPRRVIGRLAGGAVRLAPAAPTLAVAEGVETALSAAAALDHPAWAALSAHNLSRFSPPPGLGRLIIAPDRDAAGLAAADVLCARLGRGLIVSIALPDADDWNAAAMARTPRRKALRR